jgi:glucosamine 6-phosphate synthetase-like amidotransferase/phosphosugar isomerase protein
MKHGPIALIDEDLPIAAIAADDAVFEKALGNIQEAKAAAAASSSSPPPRRPTRSTTSSISSRTRTSS